MTQKCSEIMTQIAGFGSSVSEQQNKFPFYQNPISEHAPELTMSSDGEQSRMPSIPSSPVREEYEPDPQKGSGEAAALPKAKRQRQSSPGQTSALKDKGAVRPKTMTDKDDGADTAGGDRSGSLPVRSAEEGAAEGAEGEVHSSVTDEATTGAPAPEVASSAGQPSTPAAATKDVTPPGAPTNTDVVPPSTKPPAAPSSPAPAPDAEQVLEQNNPPAGEARAPAATPPDQPPTEADIVSTWTAPPAGASLPASVPDAEQVLEQNNPLTGEAPAPAVTEVTPQAGTAEQTPKGADNVSSWRTVSAAASLPAPAPDAEHVLEPPGGSAAPNNSVAMQPKSDVTLPLLGPYNKDKERVRQQEIDADGGKLRLFGAVQDVLYKNYNMDLGPSSPSQPQGLADYDVFQWVDDDYEGHPMAEAAPRRHTLALTLNMTKAGVIVDRNKTSGKSTQAIKKSLISVEIGGNYVVKILSGTLVKYLEREEDIKQEQYALMTVIGITVHLRFDNSFDKKKPRELVLGHFANSVIVKEARIDIVLVNADLILKRVSAYL